MNAKTWLPLCLAVVLGLVAAKFARDTMQKNKTVAPGNANFAQVVVTKQPIAAGEMITAENCQLGTVGTDSVPDGSFREITDLKDRVAKIQLTRGQAVTNNLLT